MNNVKTTIRIAVLLILAMACTFEVQAQRRRVKYLQNYDNAPYHFGFLLGANFMDYNLMLKDGYQNMVFPADSLPISPLYQKDGVDWGITLNDVDNKTYQVINIERDTLGRPEIMKSFPRIGFSIGVSGVLRLYEKLNLRFTPTFSLCSMIDYRYTLQINSANGVEYKHPGSHNRLLCCLEFPLHLKYRSKRNNNLAAYIIAGANPKIYFSTKQAFDYLKNNKMDLALEFGSGFDFYNPWFKMGIEAKWSFGLLNAMNKNQVFYMAQPLNGFKNKQFQISLTFE